MEFSEGIVLTGSHKLWEKISTITKRKKIMVLQKTGRRSNEACGSDFKERYVALGDGLAECHHKIPVSDLRSGQKTRISDLSILCANCHWMIHRSKTKLSPSELASLIGQRGHRQATNVLLLNPPFSPTMTEDRLPDHLKEGVQGLVHFQDRVA